MNTFYFQPAIEPQRTLGESSFRLERRGTSPVIFEEPISRVPQTSFAPDARFAPMDSEDLWTNRRPNSGSARPRRRLPVVKATGRIITQQEIDDALDD